MLLKPICKISFSLPLTGVTSGNQLDDKYIFIGTNTRLLLLDCHNVEKLLFVARVRRFYEVLALKLRGYLPLKNSLLRNLQFLTPGKPDNIDMFVKRVTSVGKKLVTVLRPKKLVTNWTASETSAVNLCCTKGVLFIPATIVQ